MAGIGFVLRKLLAKDNLSGVFQAYLHAMFASSGPWLFTVLALGSFFLVTGSYISLQVIEDFRVIILYNFAFSLVISAPFTAVSTRFLADLIYSENVDDAPGMMLGVLLILNCFALPIVITYYLFFTSMELSVSLLSVANFMLIMSIWLVCIFISAIKQYTGVTFSFIIGLAIAILGAILFATSSSAAGMLVGFNLGFSFILASLLALVFAEYPPRFSRPFRVLSCFKRYWELVVGALAYSLAIWVDKWIMWFAPEAITLPNSMVMYPHYDSAMFIAYLTVVPAMAMFLITQETTFFEHYVTFYRDIQEHANLQKIERNHQGMMNCLVVCGKNLLFLQGCICFLAVLAAPKIFDFLGMNYIQLGIFRFGVLGAAFQILTLFLTVLLSYFDYRKGVCAIQLFFFLSNTLLTLLSRHMGFNFYGYGYFLSNVMTFFLASVTTGRYIRKLPYYAFVVNNSSVNL
ncbi:MAG: exopolysaccharide Pel transporter PelG [Waddliaceae bacterium]